MKIQGIAGSKHPTLKKGDSIALSSEDKVCLMAREQVAENSPEGLRYIPLAAKLIGKVQLIQGRAVKNNPDPNQYIATVEVKFRELDLVKDRLHQAKTVKVKIHCKDCTDDIGVEDLETVDFKFINAPK